MYTKELLRSKKTVFSVQDMAVLFGVSGQYLRTVLSRLVSRGELIRIKRGVYSVKGKEIDYRELAGKMKQPSYVSMETVLCNAGVVFQDYGNLITSVSNNTFRVDLLGKSFEYYKLKDKALLNPLGIDNKDGFVAASVERAVCDRLYFSPGYYFDNVRKIDADKLLQLAPIYENKRLERDVAELIGRINNEQ